MGLYANRAVVTMCMLEYLELLLFFCSPEKYPFLQSQEIKFFPNTLQPEVPTIKGWCGAEKNQ